jgi:hypothetical protein
MAYSHQTLEGRLKLSRQLTSAYTRSGDFVDLQFSGPGRTLQIPFPDQLRPAPSTQAVRDPALPLPAADQGVVWPDYPAGAAQLFLLHRHSRRNPARQAARHSRDEPGAQVRLQKGLRQRASRKAGGAV